MGSYADWLGRYNGRLGGLGGGGSNPLIILQRPLKDSTTIPMAPSNTLANLPFFGQIRNYIDQSHKAQDAYDRTGIDAPYIDRYQRTGTPSIRYFQWSSETSEDGKVPGEDVRRRC